jgi:HEAT repeat protein
MKTLITLFAVVTAGASPENSGLEKAFQQRGVTGFLSAVRELDQKQGSERTAKALVELATGQRRDVEAAAAHALGRMGEAGKAVLPDLAKALSSSAFPADLLNELGPGDIPVWLAEVLLRPDDPSFDDAALSLATRFDLKGEKRLLPLLIHAAGQPDPDARNWCQYWAVRALGRMRGTAASARTLLVDILRKEPAGDAMTSEEITWNYVRGAAACALGQIGADPESTARLLAGMLKHPDQEIRDWCALGLGLLEQQQSPERAAKTLVGLRTGREREVEAAAAHALGRMGEAGKAVLPELARSMRRSGFPPEFLHQYDPGDIPLWLAEGLLHPGDPSFHDVGFSLAWCLDLSNETRLLPLLIQGAGHENPDVRLWAVLVLGNMGETAAPARPLLVEIVRKEPPAHLTPSDMAKWSEVRGSAAVALGQIGADPESTARLLAGMLKHPDAEIWTSSALALGQMGKEAAPAVPALVEALARDTASPMDVYLRHPAVVALGNIGESSVAGLIGALQSKRLVVRRRAADAIAGIVKRKAAMGALIKAATEDEDQELRVLATRALRFPPGLDRDDALVRKSLIRIVKDKCPEVRVEAAHVLGDMAWPEEVVPQSLIELLGDADAKVRLNAIQALLREPPPKEVATVVEPLLHDPDESVRTWANALLKRLREH